MITLFRQSSRAPPCRRLFLAQFLSPNSFPSPLSLSHKSLSRRAFVSTQVLKAATAQTPPTNSAILRRSPTVEDIESAELDVEILPESDAQLSLTERAAEVRHHFASLSQQLLIHRPWAVATPSHNFSGQTFGLSPANIRRVWRVPWVSIQNGAHTATRTRGLVRPDLSSSFLFPETEEYYIFK
jgi:hypothetical protein